MNIYATVSSGSYSPSYGYDSTAAVFLIFAYLLVIGLSLGAAFIFSFIGAKKAEEKGYSKGGWWCLIFFCGIIPFIIICCLPDISTQTQTLSSRWVCSKCGAVNFGGYTCSKCGTYKGYNTLKCSCGATLNASDAFCAKCGKPRPATVPSAPKATVIAESFKGWKCPSCGEQNRNEAKRCIGCGKEKPVNTPIVPSAKVIPESSKRWKCPTCGFSNPESMRTCNGCGKDKPTEKKQETIIVGEKWFCPYCGEQNRYEAKRCIGCGQDKPII